MHASDDKRNEEIEIFSDKFIQVQALSQQFTEVVKEYKEAVTDECSIEAFVRRLYEMCLDCTVDEAGLQYWTKQLRIGQISGVNVRFR